MDNEMKGYYSKKKNKLLNDFNVTIELLKNTQKHREIITDSVKNELVSEYEKIIPKIPYFKGYRQRMFNNMLLITAQVLTAYRVFKVYDKKPGEIWEICHAALQLRLQMIPKIKKWIIKTAWNTLFRWIMMRRAKKNVKETLCNFELEYIKGNGGGYDYGIKYTKCGHHKFLKEQDAEEMLPYVCLADIALSETFGWA